MRINEGIAVEVMEWKYAKEGRPPKPNEIVIGAQGDVRYIDAETRAIRVFDPLNDDRDTGKVLDKLAQRHTLLIRGDSGSWKVDVCRVTKEGQMVSVFVFIHRDRRYAICMAALKLKNATL